MTPLKVLFSAEAPAARGRYVLVMYADLMGASTSEIEPLAAALLPHLLADLMHAAHKEGVTFDKMLGRAKIRLGRDVRDSIVEALTGGENQKEPNP